MENAILIDRNDRVKQLPHSARNNGVGHGQKSVWYVDKPERQKLKDDLLDYVETLINQANSQAMNINTTCMMKAERT